MNLCRFDASSELNIWVEGDAISELDRVRTCHVVVTSLGISDALRGKRVFVRTRDSRDVTKMFV
jgi:hypothetical protein